jgi:uncharacterized protein with ATP-grasp and redox domains
MIVDRVIVENNFSAEVNANLIALIQELFAGKLLDLQDDGPDRADWQAALTPYLGQLWLEVPWLFAEIYFYRRLLEATHYFAAGDSAGVDPFAKQKRAGLVTAMSAIATIAAPLQMGEQTGGRDRLLTLLYGVLWGNQADLSLRPTDSVIAVQSAITTNVPSSHILIDDTPAVLAYLSGRSPDRIDLIADNAGFELICDLCLIDFLLTTNLAGTVILHLKAHPTFVSDATIADVHATLAALATDAAPNVTAFAARLQQHLSSEQLQLQADPFWTAPLSFWEMPASLQTELAQSDLVVIKGDANYRRLLGDRQWDFTTPFAAIVAYFPAPLVALRTLKSEIAAGLQPDQLVALPQQDPDWLTNGKWGLIQFVEPA